MPRAEKWDFFISYSGQDRAWAEWTAWVLEAAGYRVLIQAWDMVPGVNWVFAVDEGMRRAERTIAVMSEAYLKSEWGQLEALGVLRRDPRGRDRRLLVVRIEDCSPEGLLGMIVRIDVFGVAEQDARQALLDGVAQAALGHAKPTVPSGFPGTGTSTGKGTGTGQAARFPQHGAAASAGEQRLALAVDVEGYRDLAVGDRDELRARVMAMLFTTLGRAGVQNNACVVIDRVDGLAVILPSGFSGATQTAALVHELCEGVADLGRAVRGKSRVHARVGVAAGTVDLASPTFDGSATATARLLASSGQVRVATARSPRTPNAVVVDDDLYQAASSADLPTGFIRIPVSVDEYGWINLIPGAAALPASSASSAYSASSNSSASSASDRRTLGGGIAELGGVAAVGIVIGVLAAEEWQHLLDHEESATHPDPAVRDSDIQEHEDAQPTHWPETEWDDPGVQNENDVQDANDLQDLQDVQELHVVDFSTEFEDGLWET